MRILVVGASGYIGGRLVPLLAARGHELVLMSRDFRTLEARFPQATVVTADLLDPDTLPSAIERIDVAYYLAHSMGSGERRFADLDREAARNFALAAKQAGVSRMVYLGGLGDDSTDLSSHLASRHETGAQLAAHGVPVTEFRAAVIIGSGSASFEILRHLTERLPIMITPRWVATRCQPIGIADVLDYLLGALDHPEVTGIVELGGPDILSYGDMMRAYARIRGLHRLMIPVPVLTPRLSSYWVNLISPGENYGWPFVEGIGGAPDYTDPVVEWRPTSEASPSGLAYVRDTLFVAALRGERLWQVPLAPDGSGSAGEPAEFVTEYGRLRDAVVAP